MAIQKITAEEIESFCRQFFHSKAKTEWPTTKEIAENFGVHYSTIVKHTMNDDRFIVNVAIGCNGGMGRLRRDEYTVEARDW
jgi:RNase adaptor protein for sRNA GlmZ degradation